MTISPSPLFNERLEKLILYAMAALGAFSGWSLFKDQPMVETLQKGAILGCALVLLCLGRHPSGMREFLVPFLPFVTITILIAIYWANDWFQVKSFIALYIPIITGTAFLRLKGSVSCSMEHWRKLLLFCVTVSIVGGYIVAFLGLRGGIRNPWGGYNYQLQGLHGPAQLSAFCCLIVILYIAKLGTKKRSDWFVITVFLGLILATGVRIAIAALCAGIVVVSYLSRRYLKRSQSFLFFCFFVLFIGIGVERSIDRSLNIEEMKGDFIINTSGRVYLWPRYFELGMQHPWIGCGPDAVMDVMTTEEEYAPHNTYLELFVLIGFPGLLSYLGGWIWVIVQTLRRTRRQDVFCYRVIASSAVILALYGVTGNIVRIPFLMITFSGILASGMSVSNSSKETVDNRPPFWFR
jgi:O-antigen ligase